MLVNNIIKITAIKICHQTFIIPIIKDVIHKTKIPTNEYLDTSPIAISMNKISNEIENDPISKIIIVLICLIPCIPLCTLHPTSMDLIQ